MTTTVTRSSGPPGGKKATIEARGLTKRYGGTLAVDDLSFAVRPGVVTGFLGPNGSGKSTTMRLIMGLDAATAGDVTINGRHCHDLRWPLHEVGALLEARAIHPGRSARAHLQMLAETNSISIRRAGTFSLGMGQRLASLRCCSATRVYCCSTSRSTASTPTGASGKGASMSRAMFGAMPLSAAAHPHRLGGLIVLLVVVHGRASPADPD